MFKLFQASSLVHQILVKTMPDVSSDPLEMPIASKNNCFLYILIINVVN